VKQATTEALCIMWEYSLQHCVWEVGVTLQIYISLSYLEQETMLEALIKTEPHYSIVINLHQLVHIVIH
jgi:hypothetical protein